MDEEIRRLERRVAAGDDRARDELRRLRNRAGRVTWIADLLAETSREPVPITRIAVGVRAVFMAAGIGPARVRCISTPGRPWLLVVTETEAGARQVAKLFSLKKTAPVGRPRTISLFISLRAAEDGFDGPCLAPEHQDVFLQALGAKQATWETDRVAPARGFRRGDVVRVGARGRRNVVARVSAETLSLVPLSGTKGRIPLEVVASLVTLARDQELRFEGPRAESLRRAYRRLA